MERQTLTPPSDTTWKYYRILSNTQNMNNRQSIMICCVLNTQDEHTEAPLTKVFCIRTAKDQISSQYFIDHWIRTNITAREIIKSNQIKSTLARTPEIRLVHLLKCQRTERGRDGRNNSRVQQWQTPPPPTCFGNAMCSGEPRSCGSSF